MPTQRTPSIRRRSVDPGELAAWCDALARALRGGSSLRTALLDVLAPASICTSLQPSLLMLRRGASLSEALVQHRRLSPHLDLVFVVLRACALHGGPAAEPIDRVASALRQRQALEAERRTNSAQARMSALVMTLLPVAMLAVLLLTSGGVRKAMTTPVGLAAIALGSVFNATGWLWMRRMIGGPS